MKRFDQIICAGFIGCVLTCCDKPPQQAAGGAPKAPATQPPPAPEVETSWIQGNELGDWKAVEFGGEGPVKVKDGELQIGAGAAVTGVRYEGKKEIPVVDYELSWEAKKLDGVDFFGAATFPVRDLKTCATFVNGGWSGNVTGISCLDGSNASENKTCTQITYEDNVWHKFKVRVGAEVIEGWVNGKRVVNASIKDVKIELHHAMTDCAPLGFATYCTKGVVRNVFIKKLPAGSVKPDEDTY